MAHSIKVPSLGFTPIDNAFLDKYLPEVRGDFIKVYIICLRLGYSNIDVTIEKIASSLNLLQTDVLNAIKFWQQEGLMLYSQDGSIEVYPVGSDKKGVNETLFDRNVKEMLEDIERIIGRPLSSKEVTTYISFMEDLNFGPETVILLADYCISRRKTDIRYIEKVALGWHQSGIKSYEDAQRHITMHEEKWSTYRTILNFLGMKDQDISKPQEELLEKWIFKYNFSLDLILEACRICIMRINEGNFNYIDAIINDWYKNGVKDIKDVKKTDKKTKNLKKTNPNNTFANYGGQRQYDISELEKQLLGRDDRGE